MNRRRVIYWIVLFAFTAWIWSNSMATGEESGSLSAAIAEWVHGVLMKAGWHTDLDTLHFVIRKTAHFTEYLVLGVLAAKTTHITFGRHVYRFLIPYMILIPSIDETIQRFVPGRGPSVRDVCIDMAGFFCGVLLVKLRQRKKNSGM